MFYSSRATGWLAISVLSAATGLAFEMSSALRGDEPSKARSENFLGKEDVAAGWKLLFNGKDTEGWRRFRGKRMPDKWHVRDGVLALLPREGKSGGDIVSMQQYANFELSLQWKISPGGNSGVMYRVTEEGDAPWFSGPEYQVLDNSRHPDGRSPLTSAASCYALYAPKSDATLPVGDWNEARIVVKGNQVEHWLNGQKVVEYEFGSPDWNKRVAGSKFHEHAGFGKASKGYICLQDHGDQVEFRNIKIRSLSSTKEK